MYSLKLPTVTADQAYTCAIGVIKNKDRRTPYTDAKQAVLAICAAFDALANDRDFHLAETKKFDVTGLAGPQMVALYDDQFNSRVGTKAMRDGIKNSARHKLCPYCGQGDANELDHFLPKTLFSGTTVHPANLVPACGDCNFAKSTYKPGSSSPAVLHPYFDAAFDMPWLIASIALGALGNPVISFEVKLVVADKELSDRLKAHLEVFNLYERFRVWAAQVLEGFQSLLASNEGSSMSLDQARQLLCRNAISLSGGRVNTWERATYTAMANSDWYLQTYLHLR